ncbi:DUF4910 domain-containing protein [Spongiimicrobium salis]|uniref:DUF4910 domain-containing protein n=1 Tax=Spongiimicrobium salis TaxID=1667022 RepID=UPI00374D0794
MVAQNTILSMLKRMILEQHRFVFIFFLLIFSGQLSFAQKVPLGQEELVRHLDQELSGEIAKRNLEYISRLHRMRGSEDYTKAIDFIRTKLQEYHLPKTELIQIPTDGKTMYGTQKSRLAWDVDFAELWEVKDMNGKWTPYEKVADWAAIPMVLAQDSHTGEVIADLIDVGSGTLDTDYAQKEVKGKLVLTSSQPGAIVPLAIEKYGAVGILSYAQNQVTAWWKENENLIRWGHLESFSETKTFAFMVSLKQARAYKERLKKGDRIALHAKVKATQHPGNYDILTTLIEGADPSLKNEEIAFTCHLDHPRPGANDNASGCTAILEVARTLQKLIDEGKMNRPKRSIRFIWSPEIEGTTALLNYRPELAQRIKFNIHMDMVGGGPVTKASFHVSKSPQSIPSFMNDIGEAFGAFVNASSDAYASGAKVAFPLVSEEGGKESLQSILGEFHMGSDFQVFSEGSFRIPSIYLHDWPDRFIHTNYDLPANIDPTKLKRAGFIGAASAYFLASLDRENLPSLMALLKRQTLNRAKKMLAYAESLPSEEQENAKYYFWLQEEEVVNSIAPYAILPTTLWNQHQEFLTHLKKAIGKGKRILSKHAKAKVIYTRNPSVKGPMSVFGYDYFFDHYGKDKTPPVLFSHVGLRGGGSTYAYEALNFVNGKNNVQAIRNLLSAEFGPVPLETVLEYLEALEQIGIIQSSP